MSVVSIYQYWEDDLREKIARHLGIESCDLKYSVMGDLRILRRSIIHNGGVAWKDIGKCEIFQWFSVGDVISLDKNQIRGIISEIGKMIEDLQQLESKK